MFQWIRQQPDHSFLAIPGMDPRADCLLGAGFERFQPFGANAPIPFILIVHDQDALDVVLRLIAMQGVPGAKPICYTRHTGGNFSIGQSITLMANREFFVRLSDPNASADMGILRAARKQILLCLPLNPLLLLDHGELIPAPPMPNPLVKPPAGGWPPGTVVVGIIDDGIAFANARFRSNDDSSRVECFWQQDGVPSKPTVHYGAELAKSDIDALLLANTIAGVINEDAVYRASGLIDFAHSGHKAAAFRLAHGTHVLDLVAGADPGRPPTDRPIIAVQLPVAATAEQSGAGLESYVADAITYIQDRVLQLTGDGPRLPVAINFSYGTLAGPHDGTFPLEQVIDNAWNTPTPLTRIVVAAGNSNLGRGHEQISFQQLGDTVCLHWRVQPDGMTPSLLQIWMPFEGLDAPGNSRICVSITPPDFVESPELGETTGAGLILERDGVVVCEAVYSFQPTVTSRGVFNICLAPTVQPVGSVVGGTEFASSGVWTIKLRNVLLQPDDLVDAWIERNGLLYGYPRRGRQSYFDEPGYVRFNPQGVDVDDDPLVPSSNVRRADMINALATGSLPVVTGGLRRKLAGRDPQLAPYSAGGPIIPARGGPAPAGLTKPDGVSVSDDSYVHYGVLAAGTRSGSTLPMSGTSVAAPQVTRWAAEQLAAGRPVTRASFVASLTPWLAPPPPFARWGMGWIAYPGTMVGPRTRYWLP